jgi:hypothetical protein
MSVSVERYQPFKARLKAPKEDKFGKRLREDPNVPMVTNIVARDNTKMDPHHRTPTFRGQSPGHIRTFLLRGI